MATTHPDLAKQLVGDPAGVIAGTNKKLWWMCGNGHKWEATGNSRSCNGVGCRVCAESGYSPLKPGIFYLVCRSGQFKLGITNVGTGRIKLHEGRGWKLLDKMEGSGKAIASLERYAKKSLKTLGIPTGKQAFVEPFDGYTEAWNAAHLSVRTIRQLCRKLRVNLAEFLAM